MHKINEKLVAFVENVMKSWAITLELRTSAGNQEIGPLAYKKSEVYSKVTHSELSSLLSASIQSRGTSEEPKGTAFHVQRTQRQRFVLSWKTWGNYFDKQTWRHVMWYRPGLGNSKVRRNPRQGRQAPQLWKSTPSKW